MEIQHALFKGSWERADAIPFSDKPEFAFIGRSNVGKSSLINMLCNRKGLAKTSGTPGKTQTLNVFEIDKKLYFCDLPGYGFAKVSKVAREKFAKMIRHYLLKRENLVNLFILVDMRIPAQSIDIEFINDCGENMIPFTIIGTKCDKMSDAKKKEQLENYQNKLAEYWETLPPFILSSSIEKTGKSEILMYVQECLSNGAFKPL